MNLLKKCLIEFNNQWTNKITEKEVDDDEQLRFTLLDMQKFAKEYHKQQLILHGVSKSFYCGTAKISHYICKEQCKGCKDLENIGEQ